ncbi:hypothetical protein EUGRSUZ_L00828 [Eucalyptus grandis]|uniref:Outer envelope pore protein 37, chloroplastic n=1 Tax=Eucalyptus grandis TaxID=71139 RepID=A0A058ZWT3_EUCGR|nr:hypothetical protein EUGRSUZ_L00828 [Eucalyptus grandis]
MACAETPETSDSVRGCALLRSKRAVVAETDHKVMIFDGKMTRPDRSDGWQGRRVPAMNWALPDPLSTTPPPPPPQQQQPRILFSFPKRLALRVTSEYDSESSVFLHKVSCKLLDGLAKLKLSFRNDWKGEVAEPRLAFVSRHLSLHYDVEEQSALLHSAFDVGPRLHLKAEHDVKAQQGVMSLVADLAEPGYALELSSPVPTVGLPRATLKFPLGEVSLEERGGGSEENDEELSFIPTISLPSNALSVALKRRFSPSSKLSYWYNFDTDYWSAVYKHTYGKDFKFKAGYDLEARVGWASLWVGDEVGKAKTAPMKMKVQFMLQVPQDDINSSLLMFRVKKRWDI